MREPGGDYGWDGDLPVLPFAVGPVCNTNASVGESTPSEVDSDGREIRIFLDDFEFVRFQDELELKSEFRPFTDNANPGARDHRVLGRHSMDDTRQDYYLLARTASEMDLESVGSWLAAATMRDGARSDLQIRRRPIEHRFGRIPLHLDADASGLVPRLETRTFTKRRPRFARKSILRGFTCLLECFLHQKARPGGNLGRFPDLLLAHFRRFRNGQSISPDPRKTRVGHYLEHHPFSHLGDSARRIQTILHELVASSGASRVHALPERFVRLDVERFLLFRHFERLEVLPLLPFELHKRIVIPMRLPEDVEDLGPDFGTRIQAPVSPDARLVLRLFSLHRRSASSNVGVMSTHQGTSKSPTNRSDGFPEMLLLDDRKFDSLFVDEIMRKFSCLAMVAISGCTLQLPTVPTADGGVPIDATFDSNVPAPATDSGSSVLDAPEADSGAPDSIEASPMDSGSFDAFMGADVSEASVDAALPDASGDVEVEDSSFDATADTSNISDVVDADRSVDSSNLCEAGLTQCASSICVDLKSTSGYCGSCTHVCPAYNGSCANSVCGWKSFWGIVVLPNLHGANPGFKPECTVHVDAENVGSWDFSISSEPSPGPAKIFGFLPVGGRIDARVTCGEWPAGTQNAEVLAGIAAGPDPIACFFIDSHGARIQNMTFTSAGTESMTFLGCGNSTP